MAALTFSPPVSISPTSSGTPSSQAAKDGDASNPFSFIASAIRSFSGKNESMSNTPSLRNGGFGTWPTSVARSRSRPSRQKVEMMVEMRMCSGLDTGSASILGQGEERRHERLDLVADQLALCLPVDSGGLHRAEDIETDSGPRSRCVDGHLGAVTELGHPLGTDTGSGEALLPGRGSGGRELVRGHSLPVRLGLIDPGQEVRRVELGEIEEEVPHVALGIDDQARDAIEQRLLEDRDSEPRLARPGHTDDHTMSCEIGAVIGERFLGLTRSYAR